MYINKGLKIGMFWLVVSVLITSSSLLATGPINIASGQLDGNYTYYGTVPAKIYRYNLTIGNERDSGWRLYPRSVRKSAIIAIAAITDNTEVRVYILNNGTLVSQTVLNSMEKHFVILPNATLFKVVTSELACVLLLNFDDANYRHYLDYGLGFLDNEVTSSLPNTFYQSTSGAYVGTEFVLMASQGIVISYVILALENAEVTITREDGDVKTYSLEANTYKELMLQALTTFRIESTGNIMIQSGRPPDRWGSAQGFFVPAVEGGFLGRTFYTWSAAFSDWDQRESYGFRVSAAQDATVTVWNLETKAHILTAEVAGGSGLGLKPKAPAIVVQSSQPVTLSYIHNGSIENSIGQNGTYDAYGSGVAYIGIRPNENTPIYLPMESFVEAYFFANEETQITIDESPYTLSADSYYRYTQPGTHIIRSEKNIVVQVLHWPFEPDIQGLLYGGVQIPCIQTVDVVQEVTLTPLGEAFPITYIAVGAAAAAIAVVAVFMLRKRHS